MAFLERNLRHAQAGQGFNSIGIPVVPMEALEEYVVNMLLHRDYFVRSPWRIFIFANRIELISPGSLPENLTIEQMKAGVSVPRNVRLFSYAIKDGIPYRGIGSGVSRALKLYSDVTFENDEGGLFFKTIFTYGTKVDNNAPKSDKNADEVAKMSIEIDKKLTEEGVRRDMRTNMLSVFNALSNDPKLTIEELMSMTSLSFGGVRNALSALKAHDLIRREGGDRGGHWRILVAPSKAKVEVKG